MRADQAKTIHMRDMLASLGHTPRREDKGEWWYLSPFRQETEASFKVTRDGRAWFDHGLGQGGNILDFVMQYDKTDIRGALRFLDNLSIHRTHSVEIGPDTSQPKLWNDAQTATKGHREPITNSAGTKRQTDDKGQIEGHEAFNVTKIQPLQNRALVEYLKKRGIDAEIAKPWVQEIYYQHKGKAYFALAFANESGGHELRNPYFKGATGTKDITIIKAAGEGDGSTVAVFEGFMDFLSAIMLSGHQPTMDCIVLNSTAMQERAIETIEQMGAKTVHLYRDRDEAGETLLQHFQEQLPDVAVLDASGLYNGFKDLNDYLTAKHQTVSRTK